MRAFLVLLLVTPALAAGCLGTDVDPATVEDAAAARTPAELLEALDGLTLPDAGRALSELETYSTHLAPFRHSSQQSHQVARDLLEAHFADAGLQTTRHDFSAKNLLGLGVDVPGQNILGVLPGKDPNRLIIIGAHYDGAETAIGAAYDDGSGVFVVIELARALAASGHEWEHTLVFAQWDYEESGLLGSRAYVHELRENGYEVALYLNFDMVGINWPARQFGVNEVPLRAGFGGPGDEAHADLWRAVWTHLGSPESATTVTTGVTGGGSDHASFLAGDYAAVHYGGLGPVQYPFYHNADTVPSMIATVGGSRAELEAGFDTVLQSAFRMTFLVDAHHAAMLIQEASE